MAIGLNRVCLIGNLGADPELRYMPSGAAVVNLNLATSESWKDKQTGEQQKRTAWHRVILFGYLAEDAAKQLRKGSKVFIEGRLQYREWEKDGVKQRPITEIIANIMYPLEGRNTTSGWNENKPAAATDQDTQSTHHSASHMPDVFDDIPF